MLSLETAIRLIVIGQDLLIAAIFLFGQGNRSTRISGALLMLGISAYLYSSDAILRGSLSFAEPVIAFLALVAPMALWAFARHLFEAPKAHRAIWVTVVVAYLAAWATFVAAGGLNARLVVDVAMGIKFVSLALVAHALWIAVKGRPDDLIEKRRAFRLVFVGVISVQAAAVLIAELVLAGTEPPRWLDLTNSMIIAVMTLALAVPLLRLRDEFFTAEAHDAAPRKESTGEGKATGSVYGAKLLALMDEGYYRETGLTIPALATEIGLPEHQLRRLINGQLGFRNFSAFLNSYRVAEAKERLGDPEMTRTPVLTIALELGYASLGPFNRAFKEATGATPTEFRRMRLGTADSE